MSILDTLDSDTGMDRNSSLGNFRARLLILEEHFEATIWDDELTPFTAERRSIREWVEEHFTNYNNDSLREWLEIPKEGCWEVLMVATIKVYWSGYEEPEYDEDIEVKEIQSQRIPDEYVKYLGGTEDETES